MEGKPGEGGAEKMEEDKKGHMNWCFPRIALSTARSIRTAET
jgi:hypothetical protein